MAHSLTPDLVKDQVSLTDLLAKLGYRPIRISGKEAFYLSMLRDNDTTPSFCVDDKRNVWYDHGAGRGGSVIDFGKAFWPGIPFRQVLIKLWETAEKDPNDLPKMQRPRRIQKLPHYHITKVCALGTTTPLHNYLLNRGVRLAAEGLLQEIHYEVEQEPGKSRAFYAAGHQNELGGWEVRNKYFKGCLGKKGVTQMSGDERRLCVFEGFFDFLSWKHDNPVGTQSILVLNSLTLIGAGIKIATYYPHIEIYFDHDRAGKEAAKQWLRALPYTTNKAAIYDGFIDYNDKRKSEARAERLVQNPKPKGFFDGVEVPFER